jgi:UDP-N-acetylmuramate-alanine ligase
LSANPSHAIGALVPQLGRHARLAWSGVSSADTSASPFVIEADESDGTLRLFQSEHAIVLNVDAEHLDHYAGLEAVCEEFRVFARQVRGKLVFCADDVRLHELFADRAHAISYGFQAGADYRVTRRNPPTRSGQGAPMRTAFEMEHRGSHLGVFTLRQHGEKNVSNAAAAVALLHQLGYAPGAIADAIADFAGAARRQEELFADERFCVFDDYGHHPAEIEATLRLFKELNPRRLLVAFQPHRYTRTRALLGQFMNCFRDADRLWLTEIYAASEPPIPGVSGEMFAEAVRAHGPPVEFVPALDALRDSVRAAMQPGDVVLFLGAGDITRAAHEVADALRHSR